MYVCMYVNVYMHICMYYVNMHVCMYVCTFVCMYVHIYVFMCKYVCIYVHTMYVCMYVHTMYVLHSLKVFLEIPVMMTDMASVLVSLGRMNGNTTLFTTYISSSIAPAIADTATALLYCTHIYVFMEVEIKYVSIYLCMYVSYIHRHIQYYFETD